MTITKIAKNVVYRIHECFNTHNFCKLNSNPAKRICKCGAEEWLFFKTDSGICNWRRMRPLKKPKFKFTHKMGF